MQSTEKIGGVGVPAPAVPPVASAMMQATFATTCKPSARYQSLTSWPDWLRRTVKSADYEVFAFIGVANHRGADLDLSEHILA